MPLWTAFSRTETGKQKPKVLVTCGWRGLNVLTRCGAERSVSPVSQPHARPAPDWARPWLSGSALSSPAAGTKSQAVTPLNGRGCGRGLCAVLLPGAVGKAGAAPFLPSRLGSALSSHASSCPSFRPYTCPSIQPAVRRFTELPLCSGCCPGTLLPTRPSQVLLWEINENRVPPHLFIPEELRWRQDSPEAVCLGETARSLWSETTGAHTLSPSPTSTRS